MCDKRFIWNPSNCDCECDKACGVGEYLDYEHCKCRKKLVDKLVDECTETIEEVKLAKTTLAENENSYKCSSCTVYIVLFWIFFKINLGIPILNGLKVIHMLNLIQTLKQQFTNINGGKVKQTDIKNRTYYFCNDVINLDEFDGSKVKVDKKNFHDIDIYYLGYEYIKMR